MSVDDILSLCKQVNDQKKKKNEIHVTGQVYEKLK